MRIAVLGGAFDPIHNGHLQIAKQALKQLRVDEVWFMPSAATPLKQTQAASFSDRAAMVALAIRPYRHMKLCTLEHELEGISYTIRTVKELKKRYPKHSFCWLIGDDQARQFDRWKDSEDLKQQLPFYVFSREQHTEQLPAGLQRVVMQLIPVSSSEIRKGHKLYQVPEAVRAYMGLHALYLESMVKEQMNEHRCVSNWRRLMVWIPGLPILWELHTMYASSFRMRKRRPGCVHICRTTWRKQPLYGMAISERIM